MRCYQAQAPVFPQSEHTGAQLSGSLGSCLTAQAEGWDKMETPLQRSGHKPH